MGAAKLDKCIKYMNVLNCFWENQYTNIHGKKVNHKTSPPTFTQVPSTSGQMPIWCAASLWRSFHFNWPTCHGKKKSATWLPMATPKSTQLDHHVPFFSSEISEFPAWKCHLFGHVHVQQFSDTPSLLCRIINGFRARQVPVRTNPTPLFIWHTPPETNHWFHGAGLKSHIWDSGAWR